MRSKDLVRERKLRQLLQKRRTVHGCKQMKSPRKQKHLQKPGLMRFVPGSIDFAKAVADQWKGIPHCHAESCAFRGYHAVSQAWLISDFSCRDKVTETQQHNYQNMLAVLPCIALPIYVRKNQKKKARVSYVGALCEPANQRPHSSRNNCSVIVC